MKTIKCDRCGKEIQYVPPFMNVARNGWVPPKIYVTAWNDASQSLNEIDLCEDCMVGVYNYIFDEKWRGK